MTFKTLFSLLLLFTALKAMAATPDRREYWVDPATHFMWSAFDNGSGLSLLQAKRYCHDSRLGGFKNWRLPSIDELQQIFGGTEDANGRHIKGPITLSGWEWSSSPGQRPGEGWAFDFGDGGRASVAGGDSGLNRAICVRRQ